FGLGLAITRKLTALLNGKISVHSISRKGSTFEILLPLEEGSLKSETVEGNTGKQISFSPESKVLLVEDNPINQKVMVSFLKKLGIEPQLAENGKIGLDMIDSNRPDIIFMDLHMPVMDGFEAVDHIRKEYSADELPIIALTADAFQQQLDKTIDSGFNDYITKPITPDGLEEVLSKYLQNSLPSKEKKE
ncbi:MAG: response regulator, partial [Gammaproteobacteria bacterium]|nr:response regulator [Gammaproteobacteria bacterium]